MQAAFPQKGSLCINFLFSVEKEAGVKNKFFTQLFVPFLQKGKQKFCFAKSEQIAERNGYYYEYYKQSGSIRC